MEIKEVPSLPVFKIEATVTEKKESGKSIVLSPGVEDRHTSTIPDRKDIKFSHKGWTLFVNAGPEARDDKWNKLEVGKRYDFYLTLRIDTRGALGAQVKFWYKDSKKHED